MTTAPGTKAPPRVAGYVIAMALGFVFAYALGFGLAYLGWVVAENESLVVIGFGLTATGWLWGPLVGASVLYFRKARTADIERDARSPEAGPLVSLAEKHMQKGEYFLVIETLKRMQRHTAERDDIGCLEAASELATRVMAAPDVQPQIRDDAREFVEATNAQIASLRVCLGSSG